MAYVLIVFAFFLTVLNFVISNYDFINPSVLFCGMNLIYSIVGCFVIVSYQITFHANTTFVLVLGMVTFTLFNIIARYGRRISIRVKPRTMPIMYYKVRRLWLILFIAFEFLVAYYMIKYAKSASRAFYGSSGSLGQAIGNLNRIIKNYSDDFRKAGVHASIIYTMGWPLCIAFNTLLSVIAICNYKVTHKLPLSLVVPYLIMILMSFLTGSRSTAFRFLTQLFIEYIIIHRWYQGNTTKGNIKLFVRLLVIGSIAIAGITFSINLIGRSNSIPLFEYITAYVGGPFVNLDLVIDRDINTSTIFAQETLHHFYSLIGSRFHIPSLVYTLNIPYLYVKGHYLGNIYTMYYMFLEDFGYLGVFPLTAIIAYFYNSNYSILSKAGYSRRNISFRLFIYGYLFNDLVMLTFSNRFYETALGKQAFLFYFYIAIIWFLFRQGVFTCHTNRSSVAGPSITMSSRKVCE